MLSAKADLRGGVTSAETALHLRGALSPSASNASSSNVGSAWRFTAHKQLCRQEHSGGDSNYQYWFDGRAGMSLKEHKLLDRSRATLLAKNEWVRERGREGGKRG